MDCSKYGIICDSLYNQRKRIENTSVTQTCFTNIDWYSNTIKLCYEYLAKESIKRYGKIIDYIQFVIFKLWIRKRILRNIIFITFT